MDREDTLMRGTCSTMGSGPMIRNTVWAFITTTRAAITAVGSRIKDRERAV
jgi:hypothetical protein